MKKVFASLITLSSSAVLFAAGTIGTKNSSSYSGFVVVGFFVILIAAIVIPITKAEDEKRKQQKDFWQKQNKQFH